MSFTVFGVDENKVYNGLILASAVISLGMLGIALMDAAFFLAGIMGLVLVTLTAMYAKWESQKPIETTIRAKEAIEDVSLSPGLQTAVEQELTEQVSDALAERASDTEATNEFDVAVEFVQKLVFNHITSLAVATIGALVAVVWILVQSSEVVISPELGALVVLCCVLITTIGMSTVLISARAPSYPVTSPSPTEVGDTRLS